MLRRHSLYPVELQAHPFLCSFNHKTKTGSIGKARRCDKMAKMIKKIPKEIKKIIETLTKAKFEVYLVGGCVRDLILGQQPKDWDVATNAKPEQLTKLFPHSFCDNNFGTVDVLTGSKDPSLKGVEITPYRVDGVYEDKRHPQKVKFTKHLKEDLARRDFTINAMAMKVEGEEVSLIDLFQGQEDLKKKVVRAVGEPDQRFDEDALRMMRAVRFATTLDFAIEPLTQKAIKKHAADIQVISKERVRDELVKIIKNSRAAEGIELLRTVGLLSFIIPELSESYGVAQNKHHIYDVYEHSVRTLKYAVTQDFSFAIRLAGLLHDVGKPATKEGEGEDATFYNHEVVGAKMTEKILSRLRFSRQEIKQIVRLVRYHLFYYNVDEVGEASVRKLVRRVGRENMDDLIKVRMSDRIGSGVPKAKPYKLRHLEYMVERVSRDPLTTACLAISGQEVMDLLKIKPGPKVGQVLSILLDQIINDPKKNKAAYLKKEIEKIGKLSSKKLNVRVQEARKAIEEIREKKDIMTKKKYWVQ